ncbi:MAG: hypothetical protein COC08_03060 [Maribacter sp.]|nr:MAG: hypothetical protein COC08_03060 [Maribacter sp.]
MIKVTLVGRGNVSSHLAHAFRLAENVELVAVLDSRKELHPKSLSTSDVCIIVVSDDAIKTVGKYFAKSQCLVVHTSGSIALTALPKGIRRGVFYPLQTFTKNQDVDFKGIPLCIEAENKKDLGIMSTLASTISNKVIEINSEQRKSLHIAAIFVNNFTNHLYYIGQQLCEENKIPFELLSPLIQETVKKIGALSPYEAQTGPARRKDAGIFESHMSHLKKEDYKKIYAVLTESIQNTYGKKL